MNSVVIDRTDGLSAHLPGYKQLIGGDALFKPQARPERLAADRTAGPMGDHVLAVRYADWFEVTMFPYQSAQSRF